MCIAKCATFERVDGEDLFVIQGISKANYWDIIIYPCFLEANFGAAATRSSSRFSDPSLLDMAYTFDAYTRSYV